jgi:glycosyltransferase involved in cell wall biosynthesis
LIHLHVIPEGPAEGPVWGCGEIRLVRPLCHPSVAHRFRVTVGRQMRLPPGRIDAVVTQRAGTVEATLDSTLGLLREVRRRRLPLIYDIDDDLLSRHPEAAADAALTNRRSQIRLLLREADTVVASTPELADRVRHINTRVSVWPNALDDALILPVRSDWESASPRDLLYMGTITHLPDLMSVVAALEEYLAPLENRPTLDIVGVSDDPRISALLSRVCQTQIAPAVRNYSEFLLGMQRRGAWRVGIAPLLPHPFNRSKSDIKFLDYAVIGTVGVYADSPVYAAVRAGETGVLARPDGFGQAVRDLLDSPGRAACIRARARDYVLSERVLSRRAGDLADIIEQALDSEGVVRLDAVPVAHHE